MAKMKTASADASGDQFGTGHASLVNYGDDGKVHITAMRKRGSKLVEVGKYWIAISELKQLTEESS